MSPFVFVFNCLNPCSFHSEVAVQAGPMEHKKRPESEQARHRPQTPFTDLLWLPLSPLCLKRNQTWQGFNTGYWILTISQLDRPFPPPPSSLEILYCKDLLPI